MAAVAVAVADGTAVGSGVGAAAADTRSASTAVGALVVAVMQNQSGDAIDCAVDDESHSAPSLWSFHRTGTTSEKR